MIGRGQAIRRLFALGAVVATLTLAAAAVRSEERWQIRPDTLVARVDGADVVYRDIGVTDQDARLRFRFARNREPDSAEDLEQLAAMRHGAELERLAARIRVRVRSRWIDHLAILVTDDEVQVRWDEAMKDLDPEHAESELREHFSLLLAALIRVHDNGEDPDTVYRSLPPGALDPLEWEVQLRQYRKLETRAQLRDWLHQPPGTLLQQSEAMRDLVVAEKLDHAVDDLIAAEDPDYASYLEIRRANPEDSRLTEIPLDYFHVQRARWWGERYREADVEVVDERFEDVLGLFFDGGESGESS